MNDDDLRRRLESLTDRVAQNEKDYGDALRQIATGQGQVNEVRGKIDDLTERVGEPPEGDFAGTGMAKDLSEMKATVGTAPNDATGGKGTGMAATLADVRAFVKRANELAEKQAAKPVDLLRKVQTISAVIGTLVLVGTIVSGCGGLLIWLLKKLPSILGP